MFREVFKDKLDFLKEMTNLYLDENMFPQSTVEAVLQCNDTHTQGGRPYYLVHYYIDDNI